MAEINMSAQSGTGTVRRSKKLSTRVDLTPMVDLGFLLITFFIFTTTMSDPKAVNLHMPKDSNDLMGVRQSTALSVLPIKDDKVFYYHGELEDALLKGAFGVTTFSVTDGIGQVIRDRQAALDHIKPGNRKELVVLIKPTTESSYKNVVDMMDEMMINDVTRFVMADVSDAEREVVNRQ
jgi:biopolymer transport protein ExbD